MHLIISARRVMQALVTAFAVIIALNIIVVLLRFIVGVDHYVFDRVYRKLCVDYEQNLPSYFNALLLLMASVFTGLIHLLQKKTNKEGFKWWLLSLAFLFLSVDESASIHEFFVKFLPMYVGIGGEGIFRNAWVIVYGLGAIAFAIYLIPSLLKLPPDLLKGMILSGAVYVGGAIGVEMIGSWYVSHAGDANIGYAALATLEESLEMAGLILFIRYMLVYIREEYEANSVTLG